MPPPLDELGTLTSLATKGRVPLYQLLGGPTRHRIRTLHPYTRLRVDANGRRWYLIESDTGTLADAAAFAQSPSGFAVRCPAGMRAQDVIALARGIEPHSPLFLNHPEPAVLRRVASQTNVPVAVSAGHLEMLKDESADVLLLDLPAMGIRQAMAMAALAETHYVGVVVSGCTRDPWRSAGLHLAAALPNFIAIEAGDLPVDTEGYAELPK